VKNITKHLKRANICTAIVVGEIKHLGLRVSPLKTEIMVFGAPAGMSSGGVWVDRVLIPIGSSVRYLGLVLDAGWTFRGYFDRLLTRADGMVAALSRLMPNVGGPSGRRRRLYASIVQSVIMYGAPVWALDIGRNRKLRERLAAVQRRIALRVISAYRTVSGDAAAILAGLLPGDILAKSYRRTYLALQRAREGNPELTARARFEIRKRERRLAIREWMTKLGDKGERMPSARVREALTPMLMDGGGARWTHFPGYPDYYGARLIRGLPVEDWSGRVTRLPVLRRGGGLGLAYPRGMPRMG